MKNMILAIPKGSLFEKMSAILSRIGLTIQNDRRFLLEADSLGIFEKILIVRPQIIPFLVERKITKAGICGVDCVVEAGLKKRLVKITELNFGKITDKPVRIVVFGKAEKLIDDSNTVVFSEYPDMTKKIFRKAMIIPSPGTTEALVSVVEQATGGNIYGVGVIETGRSLKENNLKIVKVILESPVVLVAKKKTRELEIFGEILKGGLEAGKYQLLKMNVGKKDLKKVLDFIPALESPTINRLADGSFSVESVVEKRKTASVLIDIKKSGARDILLQDMNVILS